VPILPGDTAQDLANRVLEQEHLLYPKILRTFLTRFEPPS
jgi:phosphoribosylglycinamide formyltransferase-1